MSPDQYTAALRAIGLNLEIAERDGAEGLKDPTERVYKDSFEWVSDRNGIDIAFNTPDIAAMDELQKRYFPPTFENSMTAKTPYSYKTVIKSILDTAVAEEWNWQKIIRQTESFVNVNGENFPRWMYERIVRTETTRFVSEGHIRAETKMGFKFFRRIEVLDEVTNIECDFWDNHLYPADEALGVLPWHPSCRGVMVPDSKK